MKTFRSYARENPIHISLYEAQGVSTDQIQFPMNFQPMANLISLVPGGPEGAKGKALGWLLTTGLMQASIGRENLTKMVNYQLQQMAQSGRVHSFRPNSPQTLGKAIGEMAQQAWQFPGEDPPGPNETAVRPQDLFSPEARQRIPALNEVRIEGKSIDDYYAENFEPKEMSIEIRPGERYDYNLDEMRAYMKQLGQRPFQYGGVDGYMQFVEKGDYLPPEMKERFYSRNGQNGIDLRPQYKNSPDEAFGVDKNGNPVAHFVGGMSSDNLKRNTVTVAKMLSHFGPMGDALGGDANPEEFEHLHPEDVKSLIAMIKSQKALERVEQGMKTGRGAASTKLGINMTRGPASLNLIDIPNFDPESFMKSLEAGLNQPFRNRKPEHFGNPEAFGPMWDGNGPEPDGWYRIEPNGSLTFKLNSAQRERVDNFVRSGFHQGVLNGRTRWKALIPEAKPGADALMVASTIAENGLKNDQNLRYVMYKLKNGMNPANFITKRNHDQHVVTIENPDDPYSSQDPILTKLYDQGYTWEMNKQEKAMGHPNWAKGGVLKFGTSRYRVEQDPNNPKQFHLLVPSEKGEPFKAASYGERGEGWLGAFKGTHAGGLGGLHMQMTPAGQKTWKQLEERLLKGEAGGLGEPGGPYRDYTELPSVKESVATASRRFETNAFPGATKKAFPEFLELAKFAYEGLWAFSGDRAFQVGYITEEEWANLVNKLDPREELEKELQNPGTGRGIHVELLRAGITPDQQGEYLEKLYNQLTSGGPIFDTSMFPEEVRNAIGKNAFEARKRFVSKFVLNRMNAADRINKDEKKVRSQTDLGFNDEDGDRQDLDHADGSQVQGQGHYSTDKESWKVMSPKELRNLIAQQGGTTSKQVNPQPSSTTIGASGPLPTPTQAWGAVGMDKAKGPGLANQLAALKAKFAARNTPAAAQSATPAPYKNPLEDLPGGFGESFVNYETWKILHDLLPKGRHGKREQ